jgi:hypothetical protein
MVKRNTIERRITRNVIKEKFKKRRNIQKKKMFNTDNRIKKGFAIKN